MTVQSINQLYIIIRIINYLPCLTVSITKSICCALEMYFQENQLSYKPTHRSKTNNSTTKSTPTYKTIKKSSTSTKYSKEQEWMPTSATPSMEFSTFLTSISSTNHNGPLFINSHNSQNSMELISLKYLLN